MQRRALIRQGVLLGDGGLLVVAGEGLVHHLLVRLGGKQADHRHDDEPGHHGKGTAVDGGLEQRGEGKGPGGVGDQVQAHENGAEQEGHPAGDLGRFFPVQAVQEGGQEGTGQGTPGHTHELGNEADGVLILDDGDDHGDHHEDHDEAAHDEHGLSVVHLLDDVAPQQIDGQGRGGRDDQGGQGGHGGGQDQDHHHGDEDIRQAGEHGGDDGVVAVGGDVQLVGEQPAEAAQEVAAAGDDQGEEGRDDGPLVDGFLRLDGVELLDHLGQAPGAQTGQDHHAQEVDGVRAEEGGIDTGDGAVERLRVGDGSHAVQGFRKAALAMEHGGNDGDDAHQHDAALDEIVDGCGHVAASDDIDAGQNAH